MLTKALISISSMKVDKDSVRSMSSNQRTELDALATLVMNLVRGFGRETNNFRKIGKMLKFRIENHKTEIIEIQLI